MQFCIFSLTRGKGADKDRVQYQFQHFMIQKRFIPNCPKSVVCCLHSKLQFDDYGNNSSTNHSSMRHSLAKKKKKVNYLEKQSLRKSKPKNILQGEKTKRETKLMQESKVFPCFSRQAKHIKILYEKPISKSEKMIKSVQGVRRNEKALKNKVNFYYHNTSFGEIQKNQENAVKCQRKNQKMSARGDEQLLSEEKINMSEKSIEKYSLKLKRSTKKGKGEKQGKFSINFDDLQVLESIEERDQSSEIVQKTYFQKNSGFTPIDSLEMTFIEEKINLRSTGTSRKSSIYNHS